MFKDKDKSKNTKTKETAEVAVVPQPTSLVEFTGGNASMLSPEVIDIFSLDEQMEGIEPRLPQIGIAHSAQMFVMPDEVKVEEFIGIILDHNRANAWWEVSFDQSGGGTPPSCWSLNGTQPDPSAQNSQCETCAACPYNQFGSEENGRGKACKNMKRVHILLEGSSLPHRLTLPPSNLKAFDRYVTYLSGQRLRLPVILTRFRLVRTQNQDRIDYSEIDLDYVRDDTGNPIILANTKDQALEIKSFRNTWLSTMRGQEILTNEILPHQPEYDISEYTGGNGDVEQETKKAEEEIPF